MAIYPPTATFKGEHNGVGNLDKNIVRQTELSETGRYPTTRSFMPLLWSQPAKIPRALDDPNRKSHEIDEHIKILVTDTSSTRRCKQQKSVNITNAVISLKSSHRRTQ
jgi:hypothetical protein